MADLRLYVASIMAYRRERSDDGAEVLRGSHRPSLYFANSMWSARQLAEIELLKLWPIEDGFFQHRAAIEAVPESLYEGIGSRLRAGMFTGTPDPSEGLSDLYLDPNLYKSDLDSDIIEGEQ